MCWLYSFGITVIWKTQRQVYLEHLDRGGAMKADYPGPQGLRGGLEL